MQRLSHAATAIAAATLFGASAPTVTPGDEARLQPARGLDGNVLFEARITEAEGRAAGTIERVYLNTDGEVEALKVRWRAGWTHDPFTLVQPIDRYSYDPATHALVADARVERLRAWAEQDAAEINRRGGLPLDRVAPGILSGASTRANGEDAGRLVSVETDADGRITSFVTVERNGWLFPRLTRREWPAASARWRPESRTIELDGVRAA